MIDNRRVLIVDDNRAIHDDFRKILCPPAVTAAALDATLAAVLGRPTAKPQQNRFEVTSAYQGQEAFLLVKKGLEAGLPFAMAFLDVRMPPGWDGVETAKQIWEIDPQLQIVLCTAYSDYSWEEMFKKLGQRDGLLILKKPFDAVEALQLAHALTEKWGLHRQSQLRLDELEAMVEARTSELSKTNSALELEVEERKRTEKTLRESDEKFHQLADNITDAFWIQSPDLGEFYYLSPAFERIWGQSAKSLYDHPQQWTDSILPEDRERVMRDFAVLNGETTCLDIEYRITRPDGEVRWVRTRGFQVRDAAGKIIRLTGVVTDITERKQLEAQLFQSQKMETVGKLAGGVAHEFNSILTSIIGQSEMLFNRIPSSSPLTEQVTEIRNAADRAATLTRQLLAYGRKQFLRLEELNLNHVISSMDAVLRHLMGGDVVELNFVPAPGLHLVRADSGQVEQVIMNIAINARDAMPEGGKLTIETANITFLPESPGRHADLKPGQYVMLAITDTGKGMSSEVKARAFEPFFTTKGVGGGVGLGLSTSYGIIKQSGGHISVLSEPNRGATFKIYLPRVEPQTKLSPLRPGIPELPRGTETILLDVEDPALREMSTTLLKRLGYTVLVAANGLKNFTVEPQFDPNSISCIFVDFAIPPMSDKDLCEHVWASYPRARILSTSVYTEKATSQQALALLQRPYTPSLLAHKLREVLDRPHP